MSLADHLIEDDNEGYFASVSDLMVGILFVFLLMLTVFALNFRDAEDEQKIERARYEEVRRDAEAQRQRAEEKQQEAERQRNEAERQKQLAEAALAKAEAMRLENVRLRELLEQAVARLERDLEERQMLRNRLLSALEERLRARSIVVTIDPESGILRFAGDVLFQTGQAVLRPEARQTVITVADIMAEVLPCYAEGGVRLRCPSDAKAILEAVLVEGHTDRQPFRNVPVAVSEEMNDRLSTDRALTVFRELGLGQRGLDALRNDNNLPLFGFSGYGQRRPRSDSLGATEADYERNRRIDLRFVLSARTSEELQRLRERINEVLGQR